MKPFRSRLAVVVLTAASVGAGFMGYKMFQNAQFALAEQKVEATRDQLAHVEDLSSVFRDVGKAVEPSVVSINVSKKVKGVHRMPFDNDMLRRFFDHNNNNGNNNNNDNGNGNGQDAPEGFDFGGGGGGDDGTMEQIGTGSGVIIEAADGTGYILTNNHVAGGAEELLVTLSDGRQIKKAKVLGTDAKTDLAVVKIEADHLIPAKWGNSEKLEKGDWVLAFGSPFGYVGSMTHGIVSAVNRTNVGIISTPFGYEDFIQVDAPINPGNSGGPLVDIHGEVVGINTAIASRSGGFQGIGFAIPSNMAKFVYDALKQNGKVTRGWIGVKIDNVANEPDVASDLGYTGTSGVIIEETFPNTPAYGKLHNGDVVTSFNGKPIADVNQLRNSVAATPPGAQVTLGIVREGKTEDVSVKIGEQPENMVASARMGRGPGHRSEQTTASIAGMQLTDLNDNQAERLGLSGVKGALVTDVKQRSPAARAHIIPGDVITRIGKHEINSAADANEVLSKIDLDKGVLLYLTNRDGSRFASLRSSND